MRFIRTCSMIASSKGWLPSFLPTWIMPGIWCVLPSRTRLAMAVVNTRISSAATRPFLSIRRNRYCATIPLSASERVALILVGWKHVNDTIDGLGGAGRVQRAQHQVARGRCHQGQFDRFQVAQLAHQND